MKVGKYSLFCGSLVQKPDRLTMYGQAEGFDETVTVDSFDGGCTWADPRLLILDQRDLLVQPQYVEFNGETYLYGWNPDKYFEQYKLVNDRTWISQGTLFPMGAQFNDVVYIRPALDVLAFYIQTYETPGLKVDYDNLPGQHRLMKVYTSSDGIVLTDEGYMFEPDDNPEIQYYYFFPATDNMGFVGLYNVVEQTTDVEQCFFDGGRWSRTHKLYMDRGDYRNIYICGYAVHDRTPYLFIQASYDWHNSPKKEFVLLREKLR